MVWAAHDEIISQRAQHYKSFLSWDSRLEASELKAIH